MPFTFHLMNGIFTNMNFLKPRVLVAILLFLLLLSSCSTSERLGEMAAKGTDPEQWMAPLGVESYTSSLPLYYHTGAEWNSRSLELIEQARDYILVSTFLGVEHPSVFPVWDALAKKAAGGVPVYVIIDSSSNFQMVPIVNERIKAAFMQLRDMGMEVVEYNSLSLSNIFFAPKLLDRDHRKYWVVDGEILAIGGVNVNHTSVDWPPGIGNIDSMIEVRSPGATRAVIDTFVDTWNNYSPRRLDRSDFAVAELELAQTDESTNLWLLDHYWPARSQVSTLFDLFSIYPERELWMIQGYTFLTPALLDRIRFTVERGVTVHIILSEYSTQPKYEMASRYGILDLIDAGARVYMYDSPDGAFLHAKIMVADGKLSTIGSTNYNLRSQTLSRELNFLFEDDRIGSYLLGYIETLLEHCRVVSREEAESYRDFRSWYNYILMQVWG